MIWLSCISEKDLYIDVQNVSWNFQDYEVSAKVQGVIGDGVRENWCEMTLGAEEAIQIFPVWNEDGSVESLIESVDESVLSQQLLAEVGKYLYDKNLFKPVLVAEDIERQPREMNAQLAA